METINGTVSLPVTHGFKKLLLGSVNEKFHFSYLRACYFTETILPVAACSVFVKLLVLLSPGLVSARIPSFIFSLRVLFPVRSSNQHSMWNVCGMLAVSTN